METLSGLHLNDIIKLQIMAVFWVSLRENIYCWHALTNKSCLMTMHESLCGKNFFVLTSWFGGIKEDIQDASESFREHLATRWAENVIYKKSLSSLKHSIPIIWLKQKVCFRNPAH